MALRVDEVARTGITLATAGQTFTRLTSSINGVSTAWSPTFADRGGGAYEASHTVTQEGTWLWWGTATDGTPIVIEWDVEGIAASVPVISVGSAGNTRKAIRRAVADRLDDIKVLTATVASSGLNTFRDDVELTDAQNAYLASQAMPTGGTGANLGRIVRVLGSDATTHTLTVTPDLPAIPQAGDEWELVNLNGRGWRFQDYHRVTNEVLGDARGGARITVSATIAAAFDADDPEVTIPATLTDLSGVYVVDADGERTAIPRARRPGEYGNGYWMEGRTLRIEGGYREFADGLTVVLTGTGPHPALASDSDICTVDLGWLVPEVASRLAAGPDRQRQALSDRLKSEAEARRLNARRPRSANSWVIR